MMHCKRVNTDLTQAENGIPQEMLNQLRAPRGKEKISA